MLNIKPEVNNVHLALKVNEISKTDQKCLLIRSHWNKQSVRLPVSCDENTFHTKEAATEGLFQVNITGCSDRFIAECRLQLFECQIARLAGLHGHGGRPAHGAGHGPGRIVAMSSCHRYLRLLALIRYGSQSGSVRSGWSTGARLGREMENETSRARLIVGGTFLFHISKPFVFIAVFVFLCDA